MRNKSIILCAAAAVAAIASYGFDKSERDRVFSLAQEQYRIILAKYDATTNTFPRSWTNGKYMTEPAIGWTSGFFPGCLWLVYGQTHDKFWQERAVDWTRRLESAKHYTKNHDMGFMFFCSYGLGYALSPDALPEAPQVIADATAALLTRWVPELGLIRSWDYPKFMQCPVIIDSMMNLEMIEWNAKRSNDNSALEKAISHADRILSSQFRPDGSAYHVTDWNPKTGRVYARFAWQGACVEGAWARGQAWSVYGFTMMYRETKERRYLDQAVRSADWIIAHAPEDAIPYWDYVVDPALSEKFPRYEFNAKDAVILAPRDASAAAVTASALIELETFVPGKGYRAFAERILTSLCSPKYLAKPGECGGFLLKHSTGNLPEDTEIDASINYADYYFLEALSRL